MCLHVCNITSQDSEGSSWSCDIKGIHGLLEGEPPGSDPMILYGNPLGGNQNIKSQSCNAVNILVSLNLLYKYIVHYIVCDIIKILTHSIFFIHYQCIIYC